MYNTRDAAMKWKGMGEFKALHSLTEMARLNSGVSHLDGALLFGKSYETALETLEFSDPRHPELRFDSIYPHIHFLPLDDFGARLLGNRYTYRLERKAAGFALRALYPHLRPWHHGV